MIGEYLRRAIGGHRRMLGAGLALLLAAVTIDDTPARGQIITTAPPSTGGAAGFRRTVPTDEYFAVCAGMYDGNYADALRDFQGCLRSAIKTPTSFWIDAICYHTMCGETYYQTGQYALALDQYAMALQLQVAFNDWLIPMKFDIGIRPANQSSLKPIPWGQPQRQMNIGHFADSVLIQQGQVDHTAKIAAGGGVIQGATQITINPQEIIRCVCLALRRRHEILGPLAPYDTLSGQVVAVMSKRPVQPNHWSESWVDVVLGCAFAAVGKDDQARPLLEKSLLAGGVYDHPMTSIALVELGRIALNSGDYDLATKYFHEASYSAFYFYDPMIVEDSLRYAAITHFLANRGGTYAQLAPAANWARLQDYRQLQATMMLLAAENQCMLGQPKAAAATLDGVRMVMNRRDMQRGRVGAQLNLIQSLANYQLGNSAAGDASINAALAFAKTGSLRLFRISLIDQMIVNRTLQSRAASELFAELLSDPTTGNWIGDPLEALAGLTFTQASYYERWLEISLERKELDGRRAMEIADLAKRRKFLATQELGGRILALRWLLESPAAALSPQAALQRQALLTQFPAYDNRSKQARDLRTELTQMPLVAADPEQAKVQAGKLAELQKACDDLELMIRVMAVRRLPTEIVFPPVRSYEDVRKSLPDGHALLTFFVGSRNTFGFLTTNEKFGYWPVSAVPEVQKKLVAVLQGIGNFDENKIMKLSDLQNDGWRQPSRELLDLLTKESRASIPYGFTELIIVPDAYLWYVPFEVLCASPQGDENMRPLLEQVRVRYAPTMGLAVGDTLPRLDRGKSLVVGGKLYPTDDEAVAEAGFAEFARVVPQSELLKPKAKQASPAVYAGLADRLVTFADIVPGTGGYYQFAPLTGEKAAPGGTLGDWLRLPWHGPEHVALPGFHSAAENALKKVSPTEAGNDLFLATTGLMAGGARTVLISRWRPGGRTSYDLVREFMQELPYASASQAWQRSVLLSMGMPISPDAEPRVHLDAAESPPKPESPFFWGAYMVIDSGTEPPPPQAAAAN